MAGRGIVFRAIYQEAGAPDKAFEIEVAKHSPLSIVKEQLHALLPANPGHMSLVLQSDDDPEDGTLLEHDFASVQQMGIRSGSTIWVSCLSSSGSGTPSRVKTRTSSPPISPVVDALSSSEPPAVDGGAKADPDDSQDDPLAAAELRARGEMREWLRLSQETRARERHEDEMRRRVALEQSGLVPDTLAPAPVHEHTVTRDVIIDTPVQPRQADHSYNGVVFDIRAHGAHELVIKSLWLGGMLGTVRVFAMRSGPWHQGQFQQKIRRCGWNNANDVIDRQDWEEVGCQRLPAAWDGTRELKLSKPVRICPGHSRGFYVHSGLPDDLGIQYQSYGDEHDIVVEDDFLTVHPGIGHTGSHAFENYHGWFRAIRGPCGAFSYTATLRSWTAQTHRSFPPALKNAVLAMLLGQQRQGTVLSLLPRDTILEIMEWCDWGWFDGAGLAQSDEEDEDDEDEEAPTIEEVLNLLPEHRRASIGRSLSIMGEQQQLRAIARLWERYDGETWRRQQRAAARSATALQQQREQGANAMDHAWAFFGSDDDEDDDDDVSLSSSSDDASLRSTEGEFSVIGDSDHDSNDDDDGVDAMHEPHWVRRYYVATSSATSDEDEEEEDQEGDEGGQQSGGGAEVPLIVEDLDEEPEPEPEPEPETETETEPEPELDAEPEAEVEHAVEGSKVVEEELEKAVEAGGGGATAAKDEEASYEPPETEASAEPTETEVPAEHGKTKAEAPSG
jgi:hypothetical protein